MGNKSETTPSDSGFIGAALAQGETVKSLLKDERLYDLKAVAKKTGYSARYLRRLCHEGKIAHQKFFSHYYLTPEDLSAIIKPVPKETIK